MILKSTIKKKWFDMILSGEKKEEYKQIKPFWINRLTWHEYHNYGTIKMIPVLASGEAIKSKYFDAMQLFNGWACDERHPNIIVEIKGIHYGFPENEKWCEKSDVNKWFFCIELGKIIKTKTK